MPRSKERELEEPTQNLALQYIMGRNARQKDLSSVLLPLLHHVKPTPDAQRRPTHCHHQCFRQRCSCTLPHDSSWLGTGALMTSCWTLRMHARQTTSPPVPWGAAAAGPKPLLTAPRALAKAEPLVVSATISFRPHRSPSATAAHMYVSLEGNIDVGRTCGDELFGVRCWERGRLWSGRRRLGGREIGRGEPSGLWATAALAGKCPAQGMESSYPGQEPTIPGIPVAL